MVKMVVVQEEYGDGDVVQDEDGEDGDDGDVVQEEHGEDGEDGCCARGRW